MTDRTRPMPRICSACDGFATVKVTVGGRNRHGHLRTITVHCGTCNGLGTRTTRRARFVWQVAA
ncbi:hypothetical protein [Streptomyces sp. KL118A]|uniref:hypothetical protein n=1 Tax=Streptomyces sp. KL118A TaxID=3045153 RepID=UPI00278BCE5E|nr:hypothetical protein [Streptomyces sp. KL118A]